MSTTGVTTRRTAKQMLRSMLECARPSQSEKTSSKEKKMKTSRQEGNSTKEVVVEKIPQSSEIVEGSNTKSAKKGRKRGNREMDDPFNVPPNKFTMATFKAVEPFVVVDTSGDLPAYNKFTRRMNKRAVTFVVKHAARLLIRVENQLSDDLTTELSIRPYHTALLQSIGSFSKVSKEERRKIDEFANAEEEEEGEDEALKAFYLSSGGHAAVSLDSRSTSSDEGFKLAYEVAPQGEDNTKAIGRTDFRVYNYDRAPLRLGLPQSSIADEVDTKRLTIVAESKFLTEVDAVFQACGYARPEALRNMQNFHLKPIYLLVMADVKWTYAILDVWGTIGIINNRIDEGSMTELLELEKLRFAGKNYTPTKLEDLQSRFENKMKGSVVYHKRKYLVGRLHMANSWYDLPSTRRAGSFGTPGSFLFFEGLLRITAGDKVLKWTAEDAKRAYDQRSIFEDVLLKFQSGLSWEAEEGECSKKKAKLGDGQGGPAPV